MIICDMALAMTEFNEFNEDIFVLIKYFWCNLNK